MPVLLAATKEFQRFIVALTIEEVSQLRRNGLRKRASEPLDAFRNVAKARRVLIAMAAAIFIGNNIQTLSQRFGELLLFPRHRVE
jgi:hypothetical protein